MSSWCTRSRAFATDDAGDLRCLHSGAAAGASGGGEASDVFCSCVSRHVIAPALHALAQEQALLARLHEAVRALASDQMRVMDGVRERMRRAASVISRAERALRGLEPRDDGADWQRMETATVAAVGDDGAAEAR